MAKYLTLLTHIGAAKIANATALGTKINLTQMAVGDANGNYSVPNPAQTKLINEKRRAGLNSLTIDEKNPNHIIAEQIIPDNEGGYWVREIGLYDDDGDLIAVGNCPESYKPQLQEGSGRTQTIRMIIVVSHTEAVTLKTDPSVVLASREYVDSSIAGIDKRLSDISASQIKTESGFTLQQEINILNGASALYPEMYITALEIDHTEAFKRMFTDALRLKRRVIATGYYQLSSSLDGITIGVPCDLSQATVYCVSRESALQWMQKTRIFSVIQEYENITANLKKLPEPGDNYIDIFGLSGFIKISSTDVVMYRFETDNASPAAQYKSEPNELYENGKLKYSNHYQHATNSKVEYKPYLNELEIRMPKIILDGAFIRTLIRVERNNTSLYGNVIVTLNKGHCQAYIENEECCDFYSENITLSIDYGAENKGGYAITFKNTSSMLLDRIVDPHGWAGIDGNCYRGLKVTNSHLLTVGGHFSISDIHVDRTTIINHCNGQGWGTFKITRCKHLCPDNDPTRKIVTFSTKYDYANSWEGDIIIEDLDVILGNETKYYSIVSAMEPKYDHGFLGHCPDIYIDNIRIDINKLSYRSNDIIDMRFIDLGLSKQMGYEQYQILPRYHEIKNVRLVGNRYFTRIDLKPVFNGRNYDMLTTEQFQLIAGGHFIYTLNVSELAVEKSGRANGHDVAACYVNGFRFTTNDVPQHINIEKSHYCLPCASAWNNMTITVSNQQQNHVVFDNSIIGNTNSYNIVRYKSCTIFGGRVLGARENRCAFLDFSDVHFDWLSNSSNKPLNATDFDLNNAYGLVYKDSPVVTVRVSNCTSKLENEAQTLDEKFKGYIKNNYKLGSYYI